MIHFAHGLKVFICTEPTDMRRSFDGLSGMVQSVLKADPLSGHLFLFRNRARDSIKILYWDRDGLALWYKRLEQGTFQLPTDIAQGDKQAAGVEITESELALLLSGIDLGSVKRRKRYAQAAERKLTA
jgi:transposase